MRVLFFFLCILQGYAAFNLTWGTPAISLDSNPPIGDTDTDAKIAIDPSGNAVAVWARSAGMGAIDDIWASVYYHSQRVWTGSTKISGGANATNARVVMDQDGNATFLWDEGFPTQISSRTLSADGVWSPDLTMKPTIVQESIHAQTLPQIALDFAGNALAIWQEYMGGESHIHSAKKPMGQPWVYLGQISPHANASLNENKSLAINESGEAIAVWEQTSGACKAVYGARFVSGAWSDPIAISDDGKNSITPVAAIDGAGNCVIAWEQNLMIQSKTITAGNLPFNSLTVSDPKYSSKHPDLAMDEKGNVVAVFERYNSLHKFISGATLTLGSNLWTDAVDISAPSPSTSFAAGFPILALNAIGDGVVIWKEDIEGNIVIQGAGYSLGTWSMIKTLSSATGNSRIKYDTGVAINLTGNIMAVWPEDPSRTNSLQIKATTGVGLANAGPLPPTPNPETLIGGIASGYQVLKRFPAHADLVNILSWTPTPTATHYNIYRGNLSSLIDTVASAKYEDHQRIPKKKETYLITAVDSNGQESSPITVVVPSYH